MQRQEPAQGGGKKCKGRSPREAEAKKGKNEQQDRCKQGQAKAVKTGQCQTGGESQIVMVPRGDVSSRRAQVPGAERVRITRGCHAPRRRV